MTTVSTLRSFALAALLVAAAVSALAADADVSGDIEFHNDVVQIDFSLASTGSDVRIFTTSWLAGLNFDPTLALWASTGSDYTLLLQVDDDDTVGPGQGFYDAGLLLPTLAAGNYRVTLVASLNAANGTLLSQGFTYDSQTPIPIGIWDQPTYDPNANDQKGSFYNVRFTNVDAVTPVPEPETWALMALGLGALGWRQRRLATKA